MFKELFTEAKKPSEKEILKLYKEQPSRYTFTDKRDAIYVALKDKYKMGMNDLMDLVTDTIKGK